MKRFHIAYLYYDILNLYGENGNIKALKKNLELENINTCIHFLTVDDELEFDKYDLVYMGAGTENNQKIILPHLLKYKKEIKKAISDGKFFLITGNAINLFGKYILKGKNKEKTLEVFDYYVKEESFRMIDESIMKCSFLNDFVIGFQNQNTVLRDNKNPMFEVVKGIGSYPNSKTEGIKYNNFYGTYLVGPLLIRNPEFLKYFINEIMKKNNLKYKKLDLKMEEKAYNAFTNNFYKEYIK